MPSLFIKNVSAGYAWILKHQLAPGEALDLQKVFKGFCKPKKSSRAEEARYSEFKEGDYDEFIDWVKEEIMLDKATFALVDESIMDTTEEDKAYGKKRRALSRAARPVGDTSVRGPMKDEAEELREKRLTNKVIGKKLPSKEKITPKEIAWLPFDEVSKKIIGDVTDQRLLKMALKLAKNITGQERIRKAIEDRLNELHI